MPLGVGVKIVFSFLSTRYVSFEKESISGSNNRTIVFVLIEKSLSLVNYFNSACMCVGMEVMEMATPLAIEYETNRESKRNQ